MFQKVKDFIKEKKSTVICTTGALVASVPTFAFAEDTGKSLLDTTVINTIKGFSADIIPTVIAIVAIVVPVGLSCWAIGFGIKKGISFLQKKASKAI